MLRVIKQKRFIAMGTDCAFAAAEQEVASVTVFLEFSAFIFDALISSAAPSSR